MVPICSHAVDCFCLPQAELDEMLGIKYSRKMKSILVAAALRYLISAALEVTILSNGAANGSYFLMLIVLVILTDGGGFVLACIWLLYNEQAQDVLKGLTRSSGSWSKRMQGTLNDLWNRTLDGDHND